MDRQTRNSSLSLIFVGLASAAVWWTEVQLRGWDGLQWVGYFHLAIPFGIAMFLIWLNFSCGITSVAKRLAYLGAMAAFTVIAYRIAKWSLYWCFGAIQVWAPFEEWPLTYRLSLFSIYAVLPMIPLVFLGISRFFGIRPHLFAVVLGLAVYGFSVPLSILIIKLFNHRGAPDAIHAIKTGFCIPFLILGLGVPVIYRKKGAIRQSHGKTTSESMS